jgi:hypothetical protein
MAKRLLEADALAAFASDLAGAGLAPAGRRG